MTDKDIHTARAKTMIAEAEAMLAAAKAELKKAEGAQFPDEPVRDPWGATYAMITFQKRFGKPSGRFYTYAALRPGNNTSTLWYLTGRQLGDPGYGMTWKAMCEFIAKEEGDQRGAVIRTMQVWNRGNYMKELP